MIYKGLAITGTDTGAGKTSVACAFCLLFREAGYGVGALKPVETGCKDVPEDGLRLVRATALAGGDGSGTALARGLAWDDIVPWRFSAPLAPEEAARVEGVEIATDRIYQAMNRWMDRKDVAVLETAGGILVPLSSRFLNIDLLRALKLPVVICAANRLGVINHTLLTVEALSRRSMTTLAVVLVRISDELDPSVAGNRHVLERHTGLPVIEVPYAGEKESGRPALSGLDAGAVSAYDAIKPFFPSIMEKAAQEWARVRDLYIGKSGQEGDNEV